MMATHQGEKGRRALQSVSAIPIGNTGEMLHCTAWRKLHQVNEHTVVKIGFVKLSNRKEKNACSTDSHPTKPKGPRVSYSAYYAESIFQQPRNSWLAMYNDR